MKPPIPDDEEERARLVDDYRIVDTPQEPAFDELAKLASLICNTPVALVTIVHGQRQWLKANIGFRDASGATVHETSRDVSFCAHGVGHPDEMLVVPDAHEDARFADNPLVTGPHGIRFYAGAPLVAGEGHVLGSLCVLDQEPRQLTEIQLEGLRMLARQAQAQLDLRRAVRERDERQVELAQKAEIVQGSDDAILSKTPDGIIRSWNPGAERLYGWTAQEMIGHSIRRMILPAELDDYHRMMARLRAGERVETHDAVRIRKDGSSVAVSVTASPIMDEGGELRAIAWMSRDETVRRAARRELEEALALQVRMNEELARVNEVRSNFVSVVSHEFRTPLTVIQGFSQMLATEEFGTAEVREYANDICEESMRLGRLITDMLDLDRMESGQMRVQRGQVNLNQLVRTEAQRLVGASAPHRLALQLDESIPDVEADPDRMRQVVINLLSNAVKYSPGGGEVTARTDRDGDMVHLQVRDEGVGIPADALERIFDRYARSGTTRDSAIQGTGLGLSIVRQIVQLHGGRAWAESGGSAGKGSALHVVLPVAAASPGSAG